MKKLVIVAAMVAVIFASMASFKTTKASADNSAPVSSAVTVISVSSSTGFNIPSPSINAAIQFAEFSKNACFGGYTPNGQLFIVNNVELRLRFNQARGWDQISVNGGPPTALDPNATQKLIWSRDGTCEVTP